jgi:EAL domain-containing protein (putative c-di-GMP-specific phosphodiesterase class I)
VKGNEFSLYYQPQYNHLGEIVGAEALLRWKHPQRGMVSPANFIPVAEESGLILALGNWVMDEIGRQMRLWLDEGLREKLPRLALNISARQFHQPDFVEQMNAMLEKYQLDAAMLELELTEGLLLQDVEEAIAKMVSLKDRGFHISIDDFGTGYSSLTYLKRLPVDTLKIDQSFVRDICNDADDAVIVDTIIAMTRHLRLKVIAEGVEDESTRQFLEERGCNIYQGFLFSRPLPSYDFCAMFSGGQRYTSMV